MAVFAWGTVAAVITQSMSALTFIVVSILRSGLISTRGGFAVILGGNIGITLLVLVVTFNIKLVSLYVLGDRERGYGQRKGVQVQACRRILLRRSYDSARPCVAQGLGRAAGGPALVRRDD